MIRRTGHDGGRSWRRVVLAGIERFLAVIGLMFLIYHTGFEVTHITTSSMSPTLNGAENGQPDMLLIDRLTYRVRGPQRWELVSFYDNEGFLVAKRVVGLPGEEVAIKDGKVCINGTPLTPPKELQFLNYLAEAKLIHGQSLKCSHAEYVVLGDDSTDSYDSRFEGPLPANKIAGRPLLRFWPLQRWGLVNP